MSMTDSHTYPPGQWGLFAREWRRTLRSEPVPVISDSDVKAMLDACAGRDLRSRRDSAIIRLFFDTGARLSEIAQLGVDDVDLDLDVIRVLGKGRRPRSIPFGAKTGQALSRYLRVRAGDKHAASPQLWLCNRSRGPLATAGMIRVLQRRARRSASRACSRTASGTRSRTTGSCSRATRPT